ncbi:putative choline transport protein [Aspergillus affinis]|uniref:putative choline transport protein n=1 Tax=Aspergillus affinis TaxID=1070780 RepID=UPI0022FE681E|nr:Choline transport protein [Aspergillus affinis]KAI9042599.1 Choline transport protein [Aspergillus affinis]
MLQKLTSFCTALIYLIALFYSIQDLDAVFRTDFTLFPTAEIYKQATFSDEAAIGLIAVLFLATFPTLIGIFVTGGRMWWSLAQDNATPFSNYFSHVHPRLNCPVRATLAMGSIVSCLGCIYMGSSTAFQALISSYIVLSSLSYLGAILPHMLTRREGIVLGPFYLGKRVGFVVNVVSVGYILVTVVFFCFPLVRPVTVQNMNYTSVITVGVVGLTAVWWVWRGRRDYKGPGYSFEEARRLTMGRTQSGKEEGG